MNRPNEQVTLQARHLAERIRGLALESCPSDEQFSEIAALLKQLALSEPWENSSFRIALPHEELCYELSVSAGNASLYLISDGAGTSSPPHRHNTWAVIAGIQGQESNVLFAAGELPRETVAQIERTVVRRGETLVLPPEAIHSTEVAGYESTFHLHLYGRPLHELPSFESRCYKVAPAA